MHKNQITLTSARREKLTRLGMVSIITAAFIAFAAATGMVPALANTLNMAGLNNVMSTVLTLISTAAKIIGGVITLWGVFQMILAFRREDSEGISKQITTVVVGGVLVAFGLSTPALYNAVTR